MAQPLVALNSWWRAWKHFQQYWPFVRGIHRSPVNSPHEGQRRGALIFSLICTWINGWVNNREAGDLRRHRAHYDVTALYTRVWYVTLSQDNYNSFITIVMQNYIKELDACGKWSGDASQSLWTRLAVSVRCALSSLLCYFEMDCIIVVCRPHIEHILDIYSKILPVPYVMNATYVCLNFTNKPMLGTQFTNMDSL